MTLDRLDESCKPPTSCLQVSPAKTSAEQDAWLDSTESSRVFGGRCSGLLANLDPASYAWKMSQTSLFVACQQFLERCPPCGMTVNGRLYRQHSSAPRIFDNDSSLLPTPTTVDNMLSPSMSHSRGHRNLWALINRKQPFEPGDGSQLSILFLEEIMGYPIGWTDIGLLEMP